MGKKLTAEQFLERSIEVHGDTHDYSLVYYKNTRTKVTITCKKHNMSFLQLPSTHMKGAKGCIKCCAEDMSNIKTYSKEYYIGKIKELNLPEYKIVSINGGNDITLSCVTHGVFKTSYTSLKRCKEHNRPKCMQEKGVQGIQKNTESFKILAKDVHKDKFDYSRVVYVDNKTKINILCNTCKNRFDQKPTIHLSGKGCPNCWKNRNREEKIYNRTSVEEVSKICNVIFNDTLDFTKSECVTSNDKMKVFCKKCNTEFEQYKGHLVRGVGCQKCSKEDRESKPEKLITKLLLDKGVVFNKEHSFEDCTFKNKLRFDFYIPSISMCIEYQGQQHYKPIEIFGGEKAYNLQLKKDIVKREYCKNNNIKMLEIMYSDNIEDRLTECFTQYTLDEAE